MRLELQICAFQGLRSDGSSKNPLASIRRISWAWLSVSMTASWTTLCMKITSQTVGHLELDLASWPSCLMTLVVKTLYHNHISCEEHAWASLQRILKIVKHSGCVVGSEKEGKKRGTLKSRLSDSSSLTWSLSLKSVKLISFTLRLELSLSCSKRPVNQLLNIFAWEYFLTCSLLV